MPSKMYAQMPTPQHEMNIEDQVLSLAKIHAQQVAQAQADEQAKSISKSLLSALRSTSLATQERKRTTDSDKVDDEEQQKRELKIRDEQQKREQKLREEQQIEEKRERERQQQNHHPSMEELIQSLALTHAEQQMKEQTQKQAQALMQKLIHALYQNNNEQPKQGK